MAFSHFVLEGRLTADPIERQTKDGKPVAKFSLAVDGWGEEEASFFDCNAFDKQADLILKYLRKGHRLMIAGNIKQHRWLDEHQKSHSQVQFQVKQVNLIQPKPAEESEPARHNTEIQR